MADSSLTNKIVDHVMLKCVKYWLLSEREHVKKQTHIYSIIKKILGNISIENQIKITNEFIELTNIFYDSDQFISLISQMIDFAKNSNDLIFDGIISQMKKCAYDIHTMYLFDENILIHTIDDIVIFHVNNKFKNIDNAICVDAKNFLNFIDKTLETIYSEKYVYVRPKLLNLIMKQFMEDIATSKELSLNINLVLNSKLTFLRAHDIINYFNKLKLLKICENENTYSFRKKIKEVSDIWTDLFPLFTSYINKKKYSNKKIERILTDVCKYMHVHEDMMFNTEKMTDVYFADTCRKVFFKFVTGFEDFYFENYL